MPAMCPVLRLRMSDIRVRLSPLRRSNVIILTTVVCLASLNDSAILILRGRAMTNDRGVEEVILIF